ncbi:hypothetical protein [Halobacteriovorax sp.]|uniref:hypothetical protein n=1 Tax=Halobacteriovorax sp. TaxID=2020862 RepID=UPI0035642D10
MIRFILTFLLLLSSDFALAHAGVQAGAPWVACELKKKSDSCEYRDHHLDVYRGTCQESGNKLLCVRNKPIIKNKDGDKVKGR